MSTFALNVVLGRMFGTGRITVSCHICTVGRGGRGPWAARSCISSDLPSLDRLLCARVPYVNDRMTDGELEIFAYVSVKTYYITVLYGLHILSDLIVKAYGLGSTPIQSLSSVHRLVSDDGMCPQIVGSFKFAFPLYFDISCTLTARSLPASIRTVRPASFRLPASSRLGTVGTCNRDRSIPGIRIWFESRRRNRPRCNVAILEVCIRARFSRAV